ncbi:MAG: putative toxin-antitoxin system toxin component, PIN family [Chlamydiae bacterium]|nr:putative toxin-antitoxin system toxin component, PIN family [Chlamydiota bacterium]MBI3277125.1 putative toxin-antitoxin system toxin component, PIN family [Chlamydiota bacterium]
MRIVFDTHVLIAAFISKGACSELFEHCARRHRLVSSDFILGEFSRNLVKKFGISSLQASKAIRLLESRIEKVIPLSLETSACRDSSDIHVIGTALAGQCHCLVTGDKDLLVLKKFRHVDIISPSGFWKYESGV